MNINLRQLRAFVSIGRLGSFTRAAEALHATQPALSAQIRDLEEALGVKLFDRNTRSVSLTQAGEDLMPSVDTVLADLTSVVARARDVARRNTGRVTVAALPSLAATLMPRVIARMRDEHPGIVVVIKDALAERAVAPAARGRSRPRAHQRAATGSASSRSRRCSRTGWSLCCRTRIRSRRRRRCSSPICWTRRSC